MPSRWTKTEEKRKRQELYQLYVVENKTIFDVGKILNIAQSSVFGRLRRLNIQTAPSRKQNYLNKRKVDIPTIKTNELAEFAGIMLGDGHLNFKTGQLYVTLNKITDYEYVDYVSNLIYNVFKIKPSVTNSKRTSELNVSNVYVTSVDLMKYLKSIGLYSTNKVKDQAGVPKWIFKNKEFMKYFLKGFFDTDGSIYKLRFGIQMAFRNYSVPLLRETRKIILSLGFHPSKISSNHIYITRRKDLHKYLTEIGFSNTKHFKRAKSFGIIREP